MVSISIYLLIALVCAIFLFVVLFLGDFDMDMDMDVDADFDMDVDHDVGGVHGPSAFSLPVLLSVFTAFGSFGVIFENFGYDVYVVPILAAGVAILVGAGVYVGIWKMFKMSESNRKLMLSDLVGMKATVTVPIQNGTEGQILVIPPEQGRRLLHAIADDDIERDESVRIIELVGDVMKVKRTGPARKKKRTEGITKKSRKGGR